jgi:transcriptional regulator with XRE-family HTH domain
MSGRDLTVAQQFARNAVRCRKRAGFSQEEVGFRASLHRTEIGLLEQGKRMPRIDTFVKLATALEADPAELLHGINWNFPIPAPRTGTFRVSDDEKNA